MRKAEQDDDQERMKPVTRLLRWYARAGRALPWRNTKDSYKILVSEIMLQQTQVSRVMVSYQQWLETYPDWKTLAEASNADVIKSWAGLGYNRRALALRDIARQVVECGVPNSYEKWLSLKGIGPYTAAALTMFSLRKRAVPVDTNIRRTVGRLFLSKPYAQVEDDSEVSAAFKKHLMSSRKFYDVPQALFDLATTHCKKVPDCSTCPMRDVCVSSKAFMNGEVEAPKRMVKKAIESRHRNKKHPDRIYRGRILKLVREKQSLAIEHIGEQVDETYEHSLDIDWIKAMIERMKSDNLIKQRDNLLSLSDL